LFSGLEVVRIFYPGLPANWPGKVDTGGRPVIVSFKASPDEINSGSLDRRLGDWFKATPRDRTIWWSYYHEPEDNIENGEFTAAAYRTAWRRLVRLAVGWHRLPAARRAVPRGLAGVLQLTKDASDRRRPLTFMTIAAFGPTVGPPRTVAPETAIVSYPAAPGAAPPRGCRGDDPGDLRIRTRLRFAGSAG